MRKPLSGNKDQPQKPSSYFVFSILHVTFVFVLKEILHVNPGESNKEIDFFNIRRLQNHHCKSKETLFIAPAGFRP